MNSSHRTTDEIRNIDITIPPPSMDEPDIRFIDVHIYDQAPEPEAADTQEYQPEPEPIRNEEREEEPLEPGRPDHTRRNIILVCSTVLCLMAVGALLIVSLLPLMTPDATITIVPNTKQVRATATLTITTGTATGAQLPGRALAAITMTQARTVPTTGKGHQDARAAHGSITFYNAAPYPQVITAGTMLTGTDGVQVITDEDATIAAVSYPTLGQATVAAHAVITGPGGNIAGGDIYGPCCRLNVSAVNSPFHGGQMARDYQTVTSQDITTVASSLKTSLNQSVQAALQTQVHSDETLITPLSCQQSSNPDHQPGEEAIQVNVTISETCTGMTYITQAYQSHIMQIAHQQAGDGYSPIGQVQSTILQVVPRAHNQTELHVTIAQDYAYQVSQQQQQQLKMLVAGKSKAQATNTLLHIPGIQSVSVSSTAIPTDTKHIRVVILYLAS